jgi:hypothetical protein
MKTVAKKLLARRPAAKKGGARSGRREPTPVSLADRVIYDSPLKPRHLSPSEIQAIVDEISG